MTTGQDDLAGAPPTGEPGTLGRRFGARIIDAIVVSLLGGALGPALDFGFGWLAIQALVVFGYFVLLDATVGTTVGKGVLGLRVVGPQGGNPTVGQAAGRESFTLLGAIPYLGGPLALVAWILIAVTINNSPTRQGKHDELGGGTQVVTTRA